MILTTLVHHAMDQTSHNLSPCKASRIQPLKIRFSDTILKANKMIKGPPDSPPSRKLMQWTKERESARRAILNMDNEDPFLQVHFGLPLMKLGVYLKEDDELQGQDEQAFLKGDWEEEDPFMKERATLVLLVCCG
ncbi:transcription factor GTE9 [Prunus yedoensis var. nudiflora]|uniref:Transcription factor GTE9 n=1 Tax=Prunus yedoensis var. nudiflora TaxID=2094558 RepID=A0A314YKD9_PRUYE|nr:transcription factor GTE9 [Prunus yedoensis var. nudiflora]